MARASMLEERVSSLPRVYQGALLLSRLCKSTMARNPVALFLPSSSPPHSTRAQSARGVRRAIFCQVFRRPDRATCADGLLAFDGWRWRGVGVVVSFAMRVAVAPCGRDLLGRDRQPLITQPAK